MYFYLVVLCSIFFLSACNDSVRDEEKSREKNDTSTESLDGEQLARIHCATCHSFPEPDLLPKRSWNFLLVYMGLRMGIEDYSPLKSSSASELQTIEGRKKLIELEGNTPSKPLVSPEQWASIRNYYLETAPELSLPQPAKPELKVGLDLFKSRSHAYKLKIPITSLIFVDESNQEILIGDSGYHRLTALDKDFNLQTDYNTKGYLWLQAKKKGDGIYLLSIGDLMGGQASQKLGRLSYGVRQGKAYANKGLALRDLHRPSAMAFGDFNNDDKQEIVIANFGFTTGSVDIHKTLENGWQFEQQPYVTLSSGPGAVDCTVEDFNHDGLDDVAVLFGHTLENLSVFLNRGDGKFERKVLIEKHAAFGYVRFKWVDFDADGDLDVITVNGDNIDSDPYNTLKSYHGIRLYLNDGDLTLTEKFFYPMYGAYGVEVQDFDLDGDLDLAAVAFNPDFASERNESFVYLENLGKTQFNAKTIEMPKTDRWITIGSGDLDGDGDKDLILGGGYVPAGMGVDHTKLMMEMRDKGRPLLILENTSR